MRFKPTPAAVQKALLHVEQLYRPTALELAQRRMFDAKAAYTTATEALMRQELGAAKKADNALAELNAARAHLQSLGDQE